MREQKSINISGEDFVITQFGAIEGLKYQKVLAQVFLPALAEVQSAAATSQESAVAVGLSKLAENIDKLDEKIVEAMITRGVTKGNMAINFDNEFAGNYAKLFELLKEVVLFNFGSVFTMFGSEEG